VNPPKGSTILVFMGTNDLIKIGRGMIIPPQFILASLKENVNALAVFAKDRKIQIILTTIPPCTKYRSPWNAKLAMPAATLNAMQEYNAWLLHKRWDNIRVLDLSPFAPKGQMGQRNEIRPDPGWFASEQQWLYGTGEDAGKDA